MAGNIIGKIFRLATFGESHGKAIGGIIEGCPAGLKVDLDKVQQALDRRKPGQSDLVSPRREQDQVEFLSGILDGTTLGTPIGFTIPNEDQRSGDYDSFKDIYRPSHADFVYEKKYGIRDHRGGGRSSARETACRIVAGSLASQLLEIYGIRILAFTSSIGNISMAPGTFLINHETIYGDPVRCPDPPAAKKMKERILQLKEEGDSVGGIVACIIKGVPPGLGEPVFDKLHADLGKAMLSINAVKGFEIGSGFQAAAMTGSEHNDLLRKEDSGNISRKTNHSGGIEGGISNGEDIQFRVGFKPASTILKPQETLNNKGEKVVFQGMGRHDPCVVPRVVPVVEAMAAVVLADHYLRNKLASI